MVAEDGQSATTGYVRLVCPTYKHIPNALLPTGYNFCAICGEKLIPHKDGWPVKDDRKQDYADWFLFPDPEPAEAGTVEFP